MKKTVLSVFWVVLIIMNTVLFASCGNDSGELTERGLTVYEQLENSRQSESVTDTYESDTLQSESDTIEIDTIKAETTDITTDELAEHESISVAATDETVTEAVTEAITEAVTEAVTEALTEAVTETVTEKQTEAETESIVQETTYRSDYVLNTNTKKFHYPTCSSVDKIKSENKAAFEGTREEAIAAGYDPCGKCKP